MCVCVLVSVCLCLCLGVCGSMVVVVSAWGGLFLITIPHFDYTDTHFSKESSSNLLEAPPAAFVQAGIGFFSFVNS